MSGPLSGVRVIELAGLGPAPFAGMMLSDMGADVVRVDRPEPPGARPPDMTARGRRSIALDLKHPDGQATLLRLVTDADALIEGFRPGVTERLGIGPVQCAEVNPRLVYGRMTGWGQDGPLAPYAGHDIDYIALTGALHATGRPPDRPVPPLNLVGDFGGGGMFLAFGVACALLEARTSGLGQVVDAAMVDGAAVLSTFFYAARGAGWWGDQRGTNLLDTGAPFYDVYECADGGFLAVGALEPHFYAELVARTGFESDLAAADRMPQYDQASWPVRKQAMAELIRTKTRQQWCDLLEHTDACAAPVLDWSEAPRHPHNRARGTFVDYAGVTQPAPAPRFSRTPGMIARPPARPGEHTDEVLAELGVPAPEVARLRAAGAVAGDVPRSSANAGHILA
ncbi:MAG: CaiB/BaiF CoA-transferase family protein [Mycobacteriales bacterium]